MGVHVARTGEGRRLTAGLTTPIVLLAAGVLLVIVLAVLAVAGLRGAAERRQATAAIVTTDGHLLEDIEELYVALADADAAASTEFLRAGQEPEALRQRYDDDISGAGSSLSAIAARTVDAGTRQQLGELMGDLARYSGLVELARSNNRLGFPVGGAYQRQASTLMRDEILPAATELYDDAARRLDRHRRAATSPGTVVPVVVAGLTALVALLAVQAYVTWRTNRVVNVLLVLATGIVVAHVVGFASITRAHTDELRRADEGGTAPMLATAVARIDALRAVSEANLHLIERGADPVFLAEFDELVTTIAGRDDSGGLLARARDAGGAVAARVAEVERRLDRLIEVQQAVRARDEDGDYFDAVDIAVAAQVEAASDLDDSLRRTVETARATFTDAASSARRRLDVLGTAGVLLAPVLAAALAVVALWQRHREYR